MQGLVTIKCVAELIDGRGHTQSKTKGFPLPLNSDIFGPLHPSTHVMPGGWHTTRSYTSTKNAQAALKKKSTIHTKSVKQQGD